jgi:hypothetical protein
MEQGTGFFSASLEGSEAGWPAAFCYYDRAGRFQRSPLIVSNNEIAGLKHALAAAPRLKSLLRELVT